MTESSQTQQNSPDAAAVMPEEVIRAILAAATQMPLSQVLGDLDDRAFVGAIHTLLQHCREVQETVLLEIVSAAKDTEFGRAHHFDEIASIEDYQRLVPLSDWSDYEEYSERLQSGETNLLYPGDTTYFYKTSGTTSLYKLIPESERESIARKVLNRARIAELFRLFGPGAATRVLGFFNKPSIDVTPAGIPLGNASGRTTELIDSPIARRLTYPPQLVNAFDGDELKYLMMRTSLFFDDVTAIMGNNALMMRELVEYAQEHATELIEDIRQGTCRIALSDELKELLSTQLTPNPARADELETLLAEGRFTPRFYWPRLIVAIFWLGGSVGVFVDSLRPLLPESVSLVDAGYGSCESRINIPLKPDTPTGALSIFTGFFEFIPEDRGDPVTADAVEAGKDYEIVLTTNAGLYRYQLRDLVHIDGFVGNTPTLSFVAKTSDVANLAQEKIAGALLLDGLRKSVERLGQTCVAAQVYPDAESTRYVICIEAEDEIDDADEFARALDEALQVEIRQYRFYRDMVLGPLDVRIMAAGWGDHLLEKHAKDSATKSQVKVPVIIPTLPEDEWIL